MADCSPDLTCPGGFHAVPNLRWHALSPNPSQQVGEGGALFGLGLDSFNELNPVTGQQILQRSRCQQRDLVFSQLPLQDAQNRLPHRLRIFEWRKEAVGHRAITARQPVGLQLINRWRTKAHVRISGHARFLSARA